MHFDISHDAFDARRNVTRVVAQQGRLILDADLNEQQSVALEFARSVARDVIGWHGGPKVITDADRAPVSGCFALAWQDDRLVLQPGRYYLDGHLVHALGGELPEGRRGGGQSES